MIYSAFEFKYRRLELFGFGQQSNYYVDLPVFTLICDSNQTETFIELLLEFGNRIWNIDRPHVVQTAIREANPEKYYVATIIQAYELFDEYLKLNANRQLWPCESQLEIDESKKQTTCKQVYSITDQVVYKKLSNNNWPLYPISQFLPKLNSICLNEITGKYFTVIDTPPYFSRWPGNVELDFEKEIGAGQYSIQIFCNLPEAKYTFDDGKNWYNVGTILKCPVGSYIIKFEDLVNYKKPEDINVVIANKNEVVKVEYKLLYNINFDTNKEKTYVRQLGTTDWIEMPCSLSLEKGKYSFEFSDLQFYHTPEIIDIDLNENKTIEVRYSEIFYTITVNANITGAKAILTGEEKTLPAKFSVPHGVFSVEFLDVQGYKTPEPIDILVDGNREINCFYEGYALKILPNVSGGYAKIGNENQSFSIPRTLSLRGGVYTLFFTPPSNCKIEPDQITFELNKDTEIYPEFIQV